MNMAALVDTASLWASAERLSARLIAPFDTLSPEEVINQIPGSTFLRRKEAFDLISGMKPTLSKQLFNNILREVGRGGCSGVAVTPEEALAATCVTGWTYPVERITPYGAKILIRLVEADVLPRQRKSAQPTISVELRAYAESAATLLAECRAKGGRGPAHDEADRARQEALVADPDRIREEDFSYTSLH